MAEITAALVKELRDKTGAGMMDCKRALGDTEGDVEAAVDWLRKKGFAKAAKKAGRTAADGLIGIATKGGRGALVEVNSETDFVARGSEFQSFVKKTAQRALEEEGNLERLMAAPFHGSAATSTLVGSPRQLATAMMGCSYSSAPQESPSTTTRLAPSAATRSASCWEL